MRLVQWKGSMFLYDLCILSSESLYDICILSSERIWPQRFIYLEQMAKQSIRHATQPKGPRDAAAIYAAPTASSSRYVLRGYHERTLNANA